MTATIYMTIGLPASGKSTWAKENAEKLDAIILSSDSLRKELYGDESIQGNNGELFEELNKRMKQHLKEGKNVIYDATNISQKRRISFNKEYKGYHKKAIYFDTPYNSCIDRDFFRDRTVGEDVIKRMFHNLQIPTYAEGWDDIEIVYDKDRYQYGDEIKADFESLLLSKPSYDYLFNSVNMRMFPEFKKIMELSQDNPHHTFSVSRHIYYVYDYVFENYKSLNDTDYLKMLWVAVLHDVGKGYTKSFKNHKGEEKRYASFYGHEFVSAQIAVSILHSLGYDDMFILDVAELIQLHMRLLNIGDNEKAKDKLKKFIGDCVYIQLSLFKKADVSAK